jgi:hypothetical protein
MLFGRSNAGCAARLVERSSTGENRGKKDEIEGKITGRK